MVVLLPIGAFASIAALVLLLATQRERRDNRRPGQRHRC